MTRRTCLSCTELLRRSNAAGGDPDMYGRDGAPKLEGVETDFGVRMISCRNAGDGVTYLRVSNFVMPCLDLCRRED